MTNRMLTLFASAALFGQILSAQGTDMRAKPTDWEEINFEFNQAVIVDGFPAMLRLADLLKQHPDYKVTLVGNTDQIGSERYNEPLSLKRANAVAQFLQHYGAGANQIQVRGDGKKNLESNGRGPNPRFMNRRVVISVTAPDGTVVGDGSIASAVNDFETYVRGQMGKIDTILSQLHDLETQVRALQGDTGAIKQDTASIRQDTGVIRQDTGAIHTDTQELVRRPPPLTAAQTTEIARTEAMNAANYALMEETLRNRKYGLIGWDEGPTFANGSLHGTGKTGIFSADVYGSGLVPFGNGRMPDEPGTHGLQVDGDWVYFRQNGLRQGGLSDGIFDVGLVNRFDSIQLGTFAQFDYATLNSVRGIDAQGGAMLGNGVITIDFLFPGGSIGFFGAKGFKEYGNLSTTNTGSGGLSAYYLRSEDQAGFHSTGAIGRHLQLDSSLAFKKRYQRGLTAFPSADVKLSFIFGDMAFFAEADENTTFQNIRLGDRLVFGIEFGHWLRSRDTMNNQGVVPVSVPRPHYELLSR